MWRLRGKHVRLVLGRVSSCEDRDKERPSCHDQHNGDQGDVGCCTERAQPRLVLQCFNSLFGHLLRTGAEILFRHLVDSEEVPVNVIETVSEYHLQVQARDNASHHA